MAPTVPSRSIATAFMLFLIELEESGLLKRHADDVDGARAECAGGVAYCPKQDALAGRQVVQVGRYGLGDLGGRRHCKAELLASCVDGQRRAIKLADDRVRHQVALVGAGHRKLAR